MAHNNNGMSTPPRAPPYRSSSALPSSSHKSLQRAREARDIANDLREGPLSGHTMPPPGLNSPSPGLSMPQSRSGQQATPRLLSAQASVRSAQRVWDDVRPRSSSSHRTGSRSFWTAINGRDSASHRHTPSVGSRSSSSQPATLRQGQDLDKASLDGQVAPPTNGRHGSQPTFGPIDSKKRPVGSSLFRPSKRQRQNAGRRAALATGLGTSSPGKSPSDHGVMAPIRQLSKASMPQASTATRDDLLSSGPDSSSSDDESIPFNRNFRDDLLDARRPIRVRDSGSDSSSSEDKGDDEVKDSQPESQSQVAGARSFRARASLPNYNLKQLSSVRTLTKKGARKGSKFVDEESASSEDGDELGATTIDLGQLQYDEMKPLRTCGDRLYNEWIGTLNGRKVRVAGAGALFPKDYQPLPDVERPWVCAVRACKRTFVSTTGLGGHFNMAHRACLLNDNGDATMTVIGRRQNPEATGRYPAVVVSAVPLPDNRKTVVLGPNDPPNGKRYRQVLDPNASWAAASQSPLWRYLRTILPNTVTLPKYAPALELLALPQRRLLPDSVQDRFRDGLVDMEVDVRIVCAILLYLTGARGLCNNCSDPKGAASNMFDMCVALRPSASAALKKTFGPSTCCNCYLGGLMRPCVMVRSNLPDTESLEQVNGLDLPEAPKEELSQLPDEKEEEVVERRWSSRLMTLNSARASTRTSLSRENSTVKPTLVTPVPIPTFGQTALRKPAAAAAAGPATSAVVAPPDINNLAASLELEDWEFAPGRIRDEGEGEEGPENIAFSTAFVSQNQTVAVAPDVTFRVQMVKPGECARFTADPDRLRICSVASGKVRVKGLVAGQDFAVGPNGVWKIKGGAACVVENRLYLDAVVHVSSVPCYDL